MLPKTPYGKMMNCIESPELRFIASLVIGTILLIPLAVWSVANILFIIITHIFIHNPVDAYKGDFD